MPEYRRLIRNSIGRVGPSHKAASVEELAAGTILAEIPENLFNNPFFKARHGDGIVYVAATDAVRCDERGTETITDQ